MNEIWKPLLFNEQETGYEISSFGSIRDCINHELQDNKFKTFEGHYTFDFKLNGKVQRIKLHRFVAMTFIDNPHKLKYIQRNDDNPFNNRVDNLKWASSKYSISIDMNKINTDLFTSKFEKQENKKDIEVNKHTESEKHLELNISNLEIEWKVIYINGEVSNYDISNNGQIRVANTLKLRSLNSHTGYNTCSLIHKDKKYVKQVHRLVAEAFIPNDDITKKHVNHKNYDKLDNRVENLEWTTVSENIKHAHQSEGRKSTRISIIRWNLDRTNPVKYEFVNQAREEFGTSVSDCLAGRAKHAYGYIWEYEHKQENKNITDLDLTTFKQIENHPNFLISIDGKVYNKVRKSFLTPRQTGVYMSVVLDKKHYCIHRLIATYFIDKPENYNDKWIVNHKDGNKLNNNVSNLEWLSQSDNVQHMYDTGMRPNVRKIVQKDLEGNVIQEYINANHASRVLGKNANSQILRACKNPDKSVIYGFKWEFKS